MTWSSAPTPCAPPSSSCSRGRGRRRPRAAAALVGTRRRLTAVTRDGDVLGPAGRGGSAPAPSLHRGPGRGRRGRDRRGRGAARRGERPGSTSPAHGERPRAAAERVEAALAQLHESDARLAAVAEQLGQLGAAVRAAAAEAERTEQAIADAEAALEARPRPSSPPSRERLEAEASAEPEEARSPTPPSATASSCVASQARAAETELRLALRTGEERARALHGRADSLEGAARNEREARSALAARASAAGARPRSPRPCAAAAAYAAGQVAAVARAGAAQQRATAEAGAHRARAGAGRRARASSAGLQDELRELTDTVHRDEMARTQQRMRIEQLEAKRALEELGLDPDGAGRGLRPRPARARTCPAPSERPRRRGPSPSPFVREEQQKRLRAAERALALLGRVNPLALEEFSALEERHKFLTEQLEDLKQTRKRDLLDIVREVDERVEQVFTEAYARHRARSSSGVFARLFPGGEGRLVLTDPDDMLTTGIEVEARPPGKKVKRLSLLSGGERSLVAVAFLVALFKARPVAVLHPRRGRGGARRHQPRPAARDLRGAARELSQLLVITHQKRTMEVGDALYGVTMRGDGVSTVISQRLRDVAERLSA